MHTYIHDTSCQCEAHTSSDPLSSPIMGCVYAHTLIKSLSNKKTEVSQLPQEPTICDLTKQPDSEQQGDCHVQSFLEELQLMGM